MRTEIFMEGLQLDITDDIAALFTYQIDDLKDFGSRDTNFSKTINLPGTGRNNNYFGHSFQFEAFNPTNPTQPNVGVNFNAAKTAQCIVLVDSIQVFKGVIRLMEISIDNNLIEYQCAVFGELGGLVSALGTKLLTDLDFSEYNAAWNINTVSTSWNTANLGAGVYYPLVDYGAVSTDKVNYQFNAFRPALHVREYLVKMLAASGYTYDWPHLDTDLVKRLIVPNNADNMYRGVSKLINRKRSATDAFFLRSESGPGQPVRLTNSVSFPDGDQLSFTPNSGSTVFTYTAAVGANGFLNYSISGNAFGGGNVVTVRFSIKIAGNTIRTHDLLFNRYGLPAPEYFNVGSVNTFNIQVTNGQTVTITAEAINTTPGVLFGMDIDSAFLLFEVVSVQATPALYNEQLKINDTIPSNILQKDFLSSIVKMFNNYIIEDPNVRKRLIVRPYPDFYDYSQRVNWSKKLDYDHTISLKPMSEINARYFNFLYEKDSDYYNEQYRARYNQGYGDYTFDSAQLQGLDFVQDKKELKLIFAGSPLLGYTGLDKYSTAIMKKENSGAESKTESKIRILQAKRITGVATWSILNENGVALGSYNYYGYAGHLNDPVTPTADINFGAPAEVYYPKLSTYPSANLFNAYYSAYMAEICDKDSKLISAYFKLSTLDINRLDFRIPIFINGTLFRLIKVIDYDAAGDGLTKVELLKIINVSY